MFEVYVIYFFFKNVLLLNLKFKTIKFNLL